MTKAEEIEREAVRLYDQTGIPSMAVARDVAVLIVAEREAWRSLLEATENAHDQSYAFAVGGQRVGDELVAARQRARALGLISD